ncbi:DUF202 domain-containing protein [Haladaptatus sp. T7]|uniref:DUF202 domain-containing protein n=1 Tax=Haladaptatus sp. T7 TaxID=2029368 RepID=UPI0021A251D7|nr:DUF202 domain-containing protein [Haladaptatus sp. T7]GKZ12166.1 hypothetical protein HAL_00470 [Haladaptatus sp. T7]
MRLAREQTHLARERTILAHIRTGISMFTFGTVIVGFCSDKDFATELGTIAIVVGMLFFLGGWISYARSNRRIRTVLAEIEEPLERD